MVFPFDLKGLEKECPVGYVTTALITSDKNIIHKN